MAEGIQRCSRVKMVLPLRVLLNQQGETQAAQWAHTLDISHIGCRLGGLREMLSPGQKIALQRGQQKASFRVIWSNQLAADEHQAGIEALDHGRNIWGVELPPSAFAPKTSASPVRSSSVPPSIPLRVRWGFSLALLLLGLCVGWSRYHGMFYRSEALQLQVPVPGPPSNQDLAHVSKPHATQMLLARSLDPFAPRVQVAETPVGRVVYPVAPAESVKGRVQLQIIVAANGVVKQIHALSGNKMLAEAAARAVHLWRYSSLTGNEQVAERETSVTVTFVGGDAVSLQFPNSNTQAHVN